MNKLLTTVAAAALFVAGAAAAQDLDYDTDMDGAVSAQEFGEANAFDDNWSAWSGDDDMLTEDEWASADVDAEVDFDAWDENDDSMLSEDEFETGVFTSYDENDDGLWDNDEEGLFEEDEWF